MKLKNKKVGAKVVIRELTIKIDPISKWKKLKNVNGMIVPKTEKLEQYYHTSTGGYTHVTKHIIKNDCWTSFAIKLDNGIVDIEGNNIIIVREFDLKFLEYLPNTYKQITYSEYRKALKIIEKYETQKTCK